MATPAVHTWFWRDYPKGNSVITLTDKHAFLLVSVLVLLVAFGGDAIWYLIRRTLSTFDLFHDTTDLDRLLKADSSAFEFFPRLVHCLCSDASLLKRKRVWILLVVIFLLAIGIPVLSIFVSWAITAGTKETPQVIAASTPGAGGLWRINSTDAAAVFRNDQLNLNMTLSADNYFTSCYQSQYFTRCDSNLNVQSIPRYVTHNIPCPFDATLCRENDTTDLYLPFRIETDFIDESQLGLNTKARYSVKKAVECAPVKTEPFCLNCNAGASILEYSFGDDPYYFQIAVNSTSVPGYRLQPYVQAPSGNISLDSRLVRNDGLTTLLWLSAPGINYLEPVDDPWFEAHMIANYSFGEFFQSDYYVTLMGCVDQWQLCNNRTNICSGWQANGSPNIDDSLFNFHDAEDLQVGLILYWAFNRLDIYHMVEGRQASALNAQRFLSGLTQTGFASNQSQVEIDTWFGASLAKLQLTILGIGIGDPNFNTMGFVDVISNSSNPFRDAPQLVKFRDGDYAVIEALGVELLLGFSIPLVMISWLLKFREWRADHRARHNQAAPNPVPLTTMPPQRRPASANPSTGNNASGGNQAAPNPVPLTTMPPQRRPASANPSTGNNASGGNQAPSAPHLGSQDPRAHPQGVLPTPGGPIESAPQSVNRSPASRAQSARSSPRSSVAQLAQIQASTTPDTALRASPPSTTSDQGTSNVTHTNEVRMPAIPLLQAQAVEPSPIASTTNVSISNIGSSTSSVRLQTRVHDDEHDSSASTSSLIRHGPPR